MPIFEYKVIPAPAKGQKGKGVKGAAGRFANALEARMNELGAQGWEYVRADTLPAEERSGLTGSQTVYMNMLVFRRAKGEAVASPAPQAAATTAPAPAQVATAPEPAAPDTSIAPPTPVAKHPTETTTAAAAAAAAALTAYREASPNAPKVGPATGDSGPDDEDSREVAAQ
ncbi:hypothetical protein CLV78_102119 [Aliiruegeria haliotis]|uniref:DUF4177 domain-containing protein n=1 Tax=Aliiruegeria haliotis TaxID=1280846 RepID=A0A2T0RUR4_9RHOB|nr:DUF4177 domain-containing protein [Aliiruegeria haliotis]PRY24946.1 hypothetical protein CLV78_102119 [Aliiruegeria haliotis]